MIRGTKDRPPVVPEKGCHAGSSSTASLQGASTVSCLPLVFWFHGFASGRPPSSGLLVFERSSYHISPGCLSSLQSYTLCYASLMFCVFWQVFWFRTSTTTPSVLVRCVRLGWGSILVSQFPQFFCNKGSGVSCFFPTLSIVRFGLFLCGLLCKAGRSVRFPTLNWLFFCIGLGP